MGCRTWDAGQVRCRIGGMQDRRVVRHEGCRTEWMPGIREAGKEDAGKEGFRTGEIHKRRDT